jgi:hypothetical protein
MNHRQPTSLFQNSRLISLVALMALGTAACKSSTSPTPAAPPQQPGRADLSSDQTATADVVSVDKAERLITLRSQEGNSLTVKAGPEVRNFDQIAAGDKLRVRYHESLSATRLPAGESTSPVQGAYVAGRAKPGANPAGGVGMAATVRVKIASIDLENNIVTCSMDSGEVRTVHAIRPEGREFIKTLKIGDIVQIDYTASLALAIEKL